jgi:hypothetical protein
MLAPLLECNVTEPPSRRRASARNAYKYFKMVDGKVTQFEALQQSWTVWPHKAQPASSGASLRYLLDFLASGFGGFGFAAGLGVQFESPSMAGSLIDE